MAMFVKGALFGAFVGSGFMFMLLATFLIWTLWPFRQGAVGASVIVAHTLGSPVFWGLGLGAAAVILVFISKISVPS
jgi:hypothetical protein